jgi:DNA-binding NarL/FixJ family response regulator
VIDPGAASRPRVLIIDDHDLVRHALAAALAARGLHATPCAEVSGSGIAAALLERPELVVLDLDLGGGLTGADVVPAIRAAGARVVVLTATPGSYPAAVAISEGAETVLDKQRPFRELTDAIAALVRSGAPAGGDESRRLKEWAESVRDDRDDAIGRLDTLTPRERTILAGLGDGLRADDIAAATGASVATVRTHIKSVLAKLGVGWQLAAVALARRADPWYPVDPPLPLPLPLPLPPARPTADRATEPSPRRRHRR